ncbi:hypothetical protein ALC57_15711 [Trachymyrmex cornetzi]|uniref:Uncharacterized protein n=1 Tax=Trachymyrmex cornetzi TaxID=471704 RepID=A0A151IWD1_9HYME|nr:hypothetical protein ALC57_15711 [Trachymyrmex cornetzi]
MTRRQSCIRSKLHEVTYHTIPNVNESNNKFDFDKDDAEITIPEGSYEVRDINEF